MKRMFMMFGFVALLALVVAGCGGQEAAQVEKPEPAKKVAQLKVSSPQTHCPVMGNEVDKEVFVDHKGKRVYFCCSPCIEKFEKDPDGHIKKMEDQGITFAMVDGHDHDGDDHEGHDHEGGDNDHEGHDHG